MGIPKFLRCISERYPCLSELVKEFQIPDFDNLYLDMNGIIHSCSHPQDFDPHFSIDEEKIFASIFHYIEVLFNMVKPRKLFFIAVDGVAPRAKMNQQRARRFTTAKEAKSKEKEALEKSNKPLPKQRFDSNCITPGTVFMDRLHSQLQYFITSKISMDPLWQSCKVILSGHQTPGEGEHKIMDYIRYLKTQPDYDENTKHCLYGLDADLIMLGLCTHEPHFSLLREKVFYSRQQKRPTSPDETVFYLLHLSLLREYLDLEFQELKESLPFRYNLENIIDDWVLMGFLVGNDFIPNLPDLHINKGAFSILYKAYKEVLPTLDGYLNENGYLKLPRFQRFMEKLAEHDLETFEDTYSNLAFLEMKTGKSCLSEKKPNGEGGKMSELEELIKATNDLLGMSEEESFEEETEENEENDENDENDTFLWEFFQHKKNYYRNKLDYSKVTPEVLKSQAEGYVRAIQWNLHYYYQGCQSWSWYYPHHYAPYTSDIKDFKDLKFDFEMGEPFLPFQQLLAVLPGASKDLLPEAYRDLMTSPNSPIKDFYPEDFETDLNGKEHDWEAVVLIPFIDEKRLLEAMEGCNDKVKPEEWRRNQHGPMHVFTYTSENLGTYKSVEYFPTVLANHAAMKNVYRDEIAVRKCDLKYGLRPGVTLGLFYQGFPTLKNISLKANLKAAKVKVFEHPSRGENMILTLTNRQFQPIDDLLPTLLGKTVYTNWPYLVKSRAVAVSTRNARYYMTESDEIQQEPYDKQKLMEWFGECEDITRHYSGKLGVEIGQIDVIVYAVTLDGWKYSFGPSGIVSRENIWSAKSVPCPLQLIIDESAVPHVRSSEFSDFRDAFPTNSVVFMLGQPHFGSKGRILDSADCLKNGRLKVELETVAEPAIHPSLFKAERKTLYLPHRVAALKVGIAPRLLSRISGGVLVSMTNEEGLTNPGSKINIGLNLRFFKKNEEIPGYTKRENDSWSYSMKAIAVVAAYVEKFSRVIEYLSTNLNTNVFFVHDIFPGPDGMTEMKEMVAWIKDQEFKKVERLQCGTNILDPEMISKIESIVDQTPKQSYKRQMQIKPHFLFKSDLVVGNVPPVKLAKHSLLDRVVAVRCASTVPVGLRGTIIGIHPAVLEADYMYDILFDLPFPGGMKLGTSSERGFRLSRASFLNLTDFNRQCQRSDPTSRRRDPAFALPNNACLRQSYEEPKTSAFAQWAHQPSRPAARDDDEFQKIWTNLQTAKPQEDALKKILKIEKKTDIEEPVKSFFEKITKGAIDATAAQEAPVKSQPTNRFYLQLFSYYQKRSLGQPRFKYLYTGQKVVAQVFFSDGKSCSGVPCDDKESACESASLQALAALGEIPLNSELLRERERERERARELKIMENQMKLSNALTKPRGACQNKQVKTSHQPNNSMPPLPPSQWVGLSIKSQTQVQGQQIRPQNYHTAPKSDLQEKPQNSQTSGSKKLSASALEFVPLQVITGKRNFGKIATIQSPKQTTEVQRKAEVVAACITNAGSSSTTVKRKRRPKIAAKLNLDPNLY